MCMAKEVIEIADQEFVAFLCGETGGAGCGVKLKVFQEEPRKGIQTGKIDSWYY